MGFIGGMARLSYITCHRIELNTQSMILKNNARLITLQIADKELQNQPPSEGDFRFQWNADGSVKTDPTGAIVQNDEVTWQAEYARAIREYDNAERVRQAEQNNYKEADKFMQIQIANIDAQMKTLDTEEEVVKKMLDSSIKRGFGASLSVNG